MVDGLRLRLVLETLTHRHDSKVLHWAWTAQLASNLIGFQIPVIRVTAVGTNVSIRPMLCCYDDGKQNPPTPPHTEKKTIPCACYSWQISPFAGQASDPHPTTVWIYKKKIIEEMTKRNNFFPNENSFFYKKKENVVASATRTRQLEKKKK